MVDKFGLQVQTELLHEIVEIAIGDPMIINSFIRGFEIVAITDVAVTIAFATPGVLEYVKKEYLPVFERGAETLFQKPLTVRLVVKGQMNLFEQESSIVSKRIDPRFTFDNYVEAPFNAEAITIARQVILNPGETSPFFITSKSGLGKTHLLHAIANALNRAGKKVIYIDPNAFTREIVDLSRQGNSELTKYIEELKKYDALFFDDIQNLGERTVTLRVLFELINHHMEKNLQVVIASDKLVKELSGFEERFITRFTNGLTTVIKEPTLDDLVLVLRKKLT